MTITLGEGTPAQQTATGVAFEMLLPDGVTRQLLVVTKQNTFGFAALR